MIGVCSDAVANGCCTSVGINRLPGGHTHDDYDGGPSTTNAAVTRLSPPGSGRKPCDSFENMVERLSAIGGTRHRAEVGSLGGIG